MAVELIDRQRRWLNTLLVLATVAVGFIVAGQLSQVFFFFGDTILVFFLAWLLAFILSPIVDRLVRLAPVLPRVIVVVLVYVAILTGKVSDRENPQSSPRKARRKGGSPAVQHTGGIGGRGRLGGAGLGVPRPWSSNR